MHLIHPVILCGGAGTRLWPKSRNTRPKPFLPLVGPRTMFEATLDRCSGTDMFAPPMVVTGKAHLEHVEAQIASCPDAAIIVEPGARNTAAAIALAALQLPDDAVMLVCPSDHHIADGEAFGAAAASAAKLASEGWLVSLGITPQSPETGFGYIKAGVPLEGGCKVDRFVEKPDLETAKAFLEEGGYSWNGGIFAFRAGTFMDELRSHRPAIAAAVEAAVAKGSSDGPRFHPDSASFAEVESESVDYAVMENTDRAAMVPVSMGWSDIGNFQALRDARSGDANGNRTSGPVELMDCSNVLADSDGPRISVIGLSNVAVIVDGDEVLITTMEGAQKVGKLSGAMKQ